MDDINEMIAYFTNCYNHSAHGGKAQKKFAGWIDTLKTIKERAPASYAMEPEIGGNPQGMVGITWWYICAKCKRAINPHDAYCRHCGQEQKWK